MTDLRKLLRSVHDAPTGLRKISALETLLDALEAELGSASVLLKVAGDGRTLHGEVENIQTQIAAIQENDRRQNRKAQSR